MSTSGFKFEVGDVVWCRGEVAEVLAVEGGDHHVRYLDGGQTKVHAHEMDIDWDLTLQRKRPECFWRNTLVPDICATWIVEDREVHCAYDIRLNNCCVNAADDVIRTLLFRRNRAQIEESRCRRTRGDGSGGGPDRNCVSTPDGDCVATEPCMHSPVEAAERDPDDHAAWPLPSPGLKWADDDDGHGWYVLHPDEYEGDFERCCWLRGSMNVDDVGGSLSQWWPSLPALIHARNLAAQRKHGRLSDGIARTGAERACQQHQELTGYVPEPSSDVPAPLPTPLSPGQRVRVTEGPWAGRTCVLVAKHECPQHVDQERLLPLANGIDWWYVERIGDGELRHGRALVSTAQFVATPLATPTCFACGGAGSSLGGFYPCAVCREVDAE